MVKIVHNVGGVPGLDLALDCFSEDIERRLFESDIIWGGVSPEQAANCFEGMRNGSSHPLNGTWDEDMWMVANLAGDLFPEYHVPPNYCLPLSYPAGGKGGFRAHYDSRKRWGECVVGVSLGQTSILHFTQERGVPPPQPAPEEGVFVKYKYHPSGKYCVEVELPRRSIYAFHSEARIHWKHGIHHQTNLRLALLPPSPQWNPWHLRRSLTFRATKSYSDLYLQHLIQQNPTDTSLRARWNAQRQFGTNREVDAFITPWSILEGMLSNPLRTLSFGDERRTNANSRGMPKMSEEAQIQAAIRASLGMSEEEELQAAITVSLGSPGASSTGSASSPILLDDYDEDSDDDDDDASQEDYVKPSASGMDPKRQRLSEAACRAVIDL